MTTTAATTVALFLLAATAEAVAAQEAAGPDDTYQAAVADRLAGRNDAAAAKLTAVLAARPGDVDARLNLGLVRLAQGRLDEADAAFVAVIAAAPAYGDAWAGRARVAQRRGDRATATGYLARARALSPDDAELAALETALARPAEPQWRVDTSASYSRLSKGLPPWREGSVAVTRTLSGGRNAGLALEYADRFGASDVYVEGRYGQRTDWGGYHLALGGTPDADFRPEVQLRGGLDRRLGGGLSFVIDGAVARYPTGTVTSLQPGLAAEWAAARLSFEGRWINVIDEADEYRSGYSLRAIWAATPALRLRAGFADAPESSHGATVDVKATSLGLDIDVGERLTLRLTGVHEDRDAYDRDEVSLGLGWRF